MARPPRAVFVTLLATALCVGLVSGARAVPGSVQTAQQAPVVLAPAKGEPNRLYRALLTHFSQKGAQAACGELHKKGLACTVVRPGALRVASQ